MSLFKIKASLSLLALTIFMPSIAFGTYIKGFHEGPYLRLIGGFSRVTFDNNARTGEKVGSDYEGVFGFQFGWNLWDATAPELEMRYIKKNVAGGNREHIVNANLNLKYSFITNTLTNLGGEFHILPFVKGGVAGMVAAMPGDLQSTDRVIPAWGIGIGGGTGIDFLVKKYLSLGVTIHGDVLHISKHSQEINGSSQRIITGGWEPLLTLTGAAGIHF